jgi:hypothetical protein
MDGKPLVVLVVLGEVRLARRGRVRRLVRGAEGAIGVGGLTLRRSLRVVVENVELEEVLAASERDGSGTTGKGRGVHRHPEESHHLREPPGVTENVGRRGIDDHYLCLVRVHHRVVVDNLCVESVFEFEFEPGCAGPDS